jgi:hypothetical protein
MTETITIKLKPIIQEFLTCVMEETPQHENFRSNVRRMFKLLLEKTPPHYKPVTTRTCEYVEIYLPNFQIADKRGCYYMSDRNQREFENFLYNDFKQKLHSYLDQYIETRKRAGVQYEIKEGIFDFCVYYHLTLNSIDYEMMKKSYYRYRKEAKPSKKRRKLSDVLSSACPLIFLL